MSEPVQATKPIPVVDLEDGDVFEVFNLKKKRFLEKGVAGEVFLATTKTKPKREFAVKTFSLSTDVKEKSLRHFEKEVQVMKAVSHPHLVPCIEAARCHDYVAIIMPYYSKGDLLLDGQVNPARVHRYMYHVAKAVEHLHGISIAHNDVKLENVFLDESDRAHLGDFGLAIEVDDDSGTVEAHPVGGTREYWPPERLEADDEARIDPFKVDVYAIGVMYWLLISGESPKTGTDYLKNLSTASDLDLSPLQRFTLERLLGSDPTKRPTASEAVKMLKLK